MSVQSEPRDERPANLRFAHYNPDSPRLHFPPKDPDVGLIVLRSVVVLFALIIAIVVYFNSQ